MKLNEVLDVFGNESLEATMTPEQEFEASVESLIDEIDNVMEIRAGLEDMENGAVELAKASCESLLTGLAVREMSIANEDADLASICAAFNVKPELFGLEADEATMKEKVKDKAGKAYSAIKNSRVAKAAAAVYAKIVAFVKSFFSFDNIVIRTVKKLIAKAKGLFKKGINEGVEVQESATDEVLEAHAEAMEAVKKGLLSKSYDKVVETINALIAKIKGIEFKKPFVKSGEFIKKVLRLNPKAAEKVTEVEIKEAIKDAEPAQANKVLKAFQSLMSSIKGAFKKAISIDLKSLIKLGGKGKKSEGAAESVEFGIESLDALFGEIERVNAGIEDVEIPEEYAEIGVEGMEIFEEFDSFEESMAAVEAVEEMYIEATIPSQIAALESIAIEKGLNPDNGVSFDLFGNMSAGIEAADEVVENASEETKKTMKDRVKGAGAKVAQMAKSAFAFAKAKFSTGIGSLKRALKALRAGFDNKSPEELKAFFEENTDSCNRIFIYVQHARAALTPYAQFTALFKKGKATEMTESEVAKLRDEMKAVLKFDSKTELGKTFDAAYIDSAIALLEKAEKYSRGITGSSRYLASYNALRGGLVAPLKDAFMIYKAIAKDLGNLLMKALKGAKNLLVKVKDKVKSKFGKKKEAEEAPVEA